MEGRKSLHIFLNPFKKKAKSADTTAPQKKPFASTRKRMNSVLGSLKESWIPAGCSRIQGQEDQSNSLSDSNSDNDVKKPTENKRFSLTFPKPKNKIPKNALILDEEGMENELNRSSSPSFESSENSDQFLKTPSEDPKEAAAKFAKMKEKRERKERERRELVDKQSSDEVKTTPTTPIPGSTTPTEQESTTPSRVPKMGSN
jgi:hypothetical protein